MREFLCGVYFVDLVFFTLQNTSVKQEFGSLRIGKSYAWNTEAKMIYSRDLQIVYFTLIPM